MYTTSISSQLDLWESALEALPWRGKSPRELTRVGLGLILKPGGVKSVSDFVDPEQLELGLPTPRAPWRYQGAPLLKEVDDGDDGGRQEDARREN